MRRVVIGALAVLLLGVTSGTALAQEAENASVVIATTRILDCTSIPLNVTTANLDAGSASTTQAIRCRIGSNALPWTVQIATTDVNGRLLGAVSAFELVAQAAFGPLTPAGSWGGGPLTQASGNVTLWTDAAVRAAPCTPAPCYDHDVGLSQAVDYTVPADTFSMPVVITLL